MEVPETFVEWMRKRYPRTVLRVIFEDFVAGRAWAAKLAAPHATLEFACHPPASPSRPCSNSRKCARRLEWFRKERTWITEQHLALCRIPAPTFFEQQRAEWVAERFKSLGWEAKLDRAGNVIATLPGRRERGAVAVTAHLDTVLAPRTPDDIRVTGDGRILGPGVSDNGAGLTALLALAAAWKACAPLADAPSAPVLIANVGEEGEGNLCGMRYLCRGAREPVPRFSGAGRAEHGTHHLPGAGQPAVRSHAHRSRAATAGTTTAWPIRSTR